MQPKLFIPEGLTCKSPYVYIIRHKPTMQLYLGKKYRKKSCDSSTFMTESGYQTSSKYVKERIDTDGLNSFEVLFIHHFTTPAEVTAYEKKFLHKVNAANHPRYINKHNGSDYGQGPCLEETKKKISDTKRNKSDEEKTIISQNMRDGWKNMSAAARESFSKNISVSRIKRCKDMSLEEKTYNTQKRTEGLHNMSLKRKVEQSANLSMAGLKRFQTETIESKETRANKIGIGHTGFKLYDKDGELSKKFKEQPEDPTWVLRKTKNKRKPKSVTPISEDITPIDLTSF